MTTFQAIILGLIQGLAEFLPISSSGHLALAQHFFGINSDSVLIFAVLLHVGTLISVFIVYWKDILGLIYEFFGTFADLVKTKRFDVNKNATRRMCWLIIAATVPTAVIGFLFDEKFEKLYSNVLAIGICLVITGCILFAAEKWGKNLHGIKNTKFKHAITVGILQGCAIAPGISRSGSTIVGGLACGLKREWAVRFAFLVSIPPILGSVILELPDALAAGTVDSSLTVPILAGVIVSAVSGLIAIKGMIRLVSGKKLSYFSYYTWILGISVIVYSLVIL
ncbi:MAG: undecaprenyl-diphosphate phosphatase [Anaerovoracaceae bacterium]|nr:undecaprenyl-diphosphate phosphatase [Anaerovoracaceae bacterium]